MIATFEDFWRAYPVHRSKLDAMKAWGRLKPDEATCAQIEIALAWQRQEWRDPRFIPYPATWLRAGKWMDEQPESLPHRAIWQCPHVEHCGHKAMCDIKLAQPGKYPVREQEVT